jgi:hypothetical protein
MVDLHCSRWDLAEVQDTACLGLCAGEEASDLLRNDGQKIFYINDLDGNRIELCTKTGFGVLV